VPIFSTSLTNFELDETALSLYKFMDLRTSCVNRSANKVLVKMAKDYSRTMKATE